MKPILFAFGSDTSYRLQRLVADYCLANGRPVAFIYDRPVDNFFARMREEVGKLGCAAYSLDGEMVPGEGPVREHGTSLAARVFQAVLAARRLEHDLENDTSERARRIRRFLKGPLAAHGQRRAHAFSAIARERVGAAERLLARIDPGVVVVSEDGISGPLAVIAAARARSLAVVDLPFGYGTAEDFDIALDAKAEAGELLHPHPSEQALLRVVAPAWLKQGRHKGAVLFPPELIMAYEAHGMGLRDAWIVHGGYANVLLAESRQMLELYRREGIPDARLRLTGTPYCDTLLEGARAEPAALEALRQPRRIDPGRTRILVNWPPSYHASRAAFSEFASYREMTLAVLGWLAALPDCEVTLSLHPAAPAEDRAAVAEAGLEPSPEYVLRLIPRHDIMVSYYSSTIRWAIAAGKPVVNYDAYKLGLNVYDAAPGFVNTMDLATFKETILPLVSSEEALAAAARRQIGVAGDWGTIDGRNNERVLREIDALSR